MKIAMFLFLQTLLLFSLLGETSSMKSRSNLRNSLNSSKPGDIRKIKILRLNGSSGIENRDSVTNKNVTAESTSPKHETSHKNNSSHDNHTHKGNASHHVNSSNSEHVNHTSHSNNHVHSNISNVSNSTHNISHSNHSKHHDIKTENSSLINNSHINHSSGQLHSNVANSTSNTHAHNSSADNKTHDDHKHEEHKPSTNTSDSNTHNSSTTNEDSKYVTPDVIDHTNNTHNESKSNTTEDPSTQPEVEPKPVTTKYESVEIVSSLSEAGKAALKYNQDTEISRAIGPGFETPKMISSVIKHHATGVSLPGDHISFNIPKDPADAHLWQNVEAVRYGNNFAQTPVISSPKLTVNEYGSKIVHAPENSGLTITKIVPQIQTSNFLDIEDLNLSDDSAFVLSLDK